MKKLDFFTISTDERLEYINSLLGKYEKDNLKNVSEEIKIDYNLLCREMSKDDLVYIKRDRKYYKILKDDTALTSPISNYNKELQFLRDNFDTLKGLLTYNLKPFTLDKRVYSSTEKTINKNIKVNQDIYDDFISICSQQFSYLKIQDIISQCLLNFINENKDL